MVYNKKSFGDKSLEEWLELIERNREENRANHRFDFEGIYTNSRTELQDSSEIISIGDDAINPTDVKLVIYGVNSPFIQSVTTMFQKKTVIALFDNPESASNFSLEYNIRTVLLDLDKPTDTAAAMDIFAALKTVQPLISVLVCSNNELSLESQSIRFRGGIILKKPLFYKQIEDILKVYVN